MQALARAREQTEDAWDRLVGASARRAEAVRTWWRDQRVLRDVVPLVVVITATLAYLAIFVRLGFLRHDRFGSFDYDLGMYDQGIWQLAHGRGFMTVRGMHVFAHHANLGYLLFVPFYWLGAGPHFLNVVNAVAVTAVAWPVYLLGRFHLRSRWAGCWLALAYLGHFSPQWKIQETFHAESMAAPFLVGAFYLAARRRWSWYWVCVVGALIWKEDVALFVAVLGVVVALMYGDRWRGLLTTLLGAGWFLVATRVFMAGFQEAGAVFDNLFGELGGSAGEVVRNAIVHPTRLGEALHEHGALDGAVDLLAPFGFVGVPSPHVLALGAPQHVVNFASAQNFTWDLRWHYAFLPFLAVLLASIRTIATRRRLWISWALVAVMVGGVVLTREQGVGPWASGNYRAGYWPLTENPDGATYRELMAPIGPDDAVSTHYFLVPHLSHRERIYTFPNPWQASNYGVDGIPAPPDPGVVDVLLVDERRMCPPEEAPPSPDCVRYREIVDTGEFVEAARIGEVVRWERPR